jgi:hypothetical protein
MMFDSLSYSEKDCRLMLLQYMGAACTDSTAIAILAGNLMNHDRVMYNRGYQREVREKVRRQIAYDKIFCFLTRAEPAASVEWMAARRRVNS